MNCSYTISMIGAGFTCNASLYHLNKELEKDKKLDRKITINIFDSRGSFGDGAAFDSNSDIVLINQPTDTMSVDYLDPYHFENYLADTVEVHAQFATRKQFGEYLKSVFVQSIASLKSKGVEINLISQAVKSINKIDHTYLLNTKSRNYLSDHLVMCIGCNYTHKLFYDIKYAQYITNVHGNYKLLNTIPMDASIAILGSSLSSVDCIRYLDSIGHKGQLYCLARSGHISRIRTPQRPISLKFFEEMLSNQQFITLRDCIRSLRHELRAAGSSVQWNQYFKPNFENSELFLEQQVSKERDILQQILLSIEPYLEEMWNKLHIQDKDTFMNKFQGVFLSCKAPMPKASGRLLLKLIKNKRLTYHLASEIEFINHDKNTILLNKNNNQQHKIDYVIDTTGPDNRVTKNPLYKNLLNLGEISTNRFDGVDVSLNNNCTLDNQKAEVPTLQVIGLDTNGSYIHLGRSDILSVHAHRVAKHLISNRL